MLDQEPHATVIGPHTDVVCSVPVRCGLGLWLWTLNKAIKNIPGHMNPSWTTV